VKKLHTYIILAAMNGFFYSTDGDVYDNFQMLGYIESENSAKAVEQFFSEPPYPILWKDIEYMWSELLEPGVSGGHYGSYKKVYIDTLIKAMENPLDR
jgi:hypothetical protein